MDGYDEATYGEGIAGFYDVMYGDAIPEQIDLLSDLSGGGPVLELGIGTGRVALPLHERGIAVHGIDASEAMVGRLRQKPGGTGIRVRIGDFGRFELEERFSMIYVVFNTFFALLTQADQLAGFESVGRHLQPGGLFVVEAFVPDLARFDRGQRTAVGDISLDQVLLEVARHRLTEQRVDAQHIFIRSGRPPEIVPVSLRYAWPSELDLMAKLAGLSLRDRWGGWDRRPFTDDSTQHVSVWERQ